jgi:acetyl esterase/lipase
MSEAVAVPFWMGDVDPSQIGFPFPIDRSAYRKQAAIEYKRTASGALLLDAYRPADDARHPLVVMIHGGAWARGGRFAMGLTKWAAYLASGGLSVVSIDYRLAPATTYPEPFQDCLDAVDWAVEHADALGADPHRIGLWGDSAGGHLVLLLATSQTNPAFSGPRLRSGGTRVGATVAFYAPTDLLGLDDIERLGRSGTRTVRNFVGVDPDDDPARWREASPIEHVHADLPPILLLQGTRDFLVPDSQARTSPRAWRPSARRTASRSSMAACTASIASPRRARARH